MRAFEAFLKVEGWASGYRSVQRLLDHLARQTKSESSRRHYLETLCFLCRRVGKDPDQLAAVAKAGAEGAVQSYLDRMLRVDRSVRYVNTSLHQPETFFRSSGFRKESQLDLDGHRQPTRYKKREEYIPTDEEVLRMANHAGSPKAADAMKQCLNTCLRCMTSDERSSFYQAPRGHGEASRRAGEVP
ncbi:MAG: hypothetical protein JRM80_03255 [Nitrososphaerota archaeon]|nr:hypothetical protein [Nitrososphaerota archaeon]